MSNDHITISNQPNGSYLLRCQHCGDTNQPPLPISINRFLEISNNFQARHKHCTPAVRRPPSAVFPPDDNK